MDVYCISSNNDMSIMLNEYKVLNVCAMFNLFIWNEIQIENEFDSLHLLLFLRRRRRYFYEEKKTQSTLSQNHCARLNVVELRIH